MMKSRLGSTRHEARKAGSLLLWEREAPIMPQGYLPGWAHRNTPLHRRPWGRAEAQNPPTLVLIPRDPPPRSSFSRARQAVPLRQRRPRTSRCTVCPDDRVRFRTWQPRKPQGVQRDETACAAPRNPSFKKKESGCLSISNHARCIAMRPCAVAQRGVQRGAAPLRFFPSPKSGGQGVEKDFSSANQGS